MDQQKLLDWLNKEQKKDNEEIRKYKEDLANQLKKMNKDDLFQKPKKTLWTRIKKMIWGI
jgi:DNA-directed RNA polymerase subunit F